MNSKLSLKWVLLIIVILGIILTVIIMFSGKSTNNQIKKMSYHTNIFKDTAENTNFRQVLFTGNNSQLVIMSIPPGGEVGAETHKYTEQTLFFLSGTGVGELDGKTFPIGPGDVVVVVPGTEHNFTNTGSVDLKIYTVYAPPNHIDGRIQATKAIADADTADEAIGEKPPVK
jgi:mannose-6-phosphate isomerase-like protein (cupin superfamily)